MLGLRNSELRLARHLLAQRWGVPYDIFPQLRRKD